MMENQAAGKFVEFYTEVKAIEKRDSVLTSEQQINRLLRPGSTYFNLNPFEVLQVDPDSNMDAMKTKFKRLSLLVHPDKNQDNKERAECAFEVVRKAWSILENEEKRAKCLSLVEEAKARTNQQLYGSVDGRPKRKRSAEDDDEEYRKALYVTTMKMFAEAEHRRRALEERDQQERQRQREKEIQQEQASSLQREWQKNFDESRQTRVNSWKEFQSCSAGPKKKAKKVSSFKPPKHKAETR